MVLARQYEIPNVGRLDLLCIDETGVLVIVEFKRDLTNREAVAQILDYASWLDSANEEEIRIASASEHLHDKTLEEAFNERFDTELQGLTPQKHRMLLVAPKLDSSAERIINYLAERYEININAVFFRYAKTAQGDEILVRTVLVPDAVRVRGTPRSDRMSEANLMALAGVHKISKLVEICRNIGLKEEARTKVPSVIGSTTEWFSASMLPATDATHPMGNWTSGYLRGNFRRSYLYPKSKSCKL
jgi:hypothetical protein